MSDYFTNLHLENGVHIEADKNVIAIENYQEYMEVICDDHSRYQSDIIIVGVGISINTQLASDAGLLTENGIQVDETAKTSDDHIYAIGDCTYHYNKHFKRFLRLESVQNAVDQAKIAAKSICGDQEVYYDAIPWFWSDQYDVKLQIVGLFTGYDDLVVRNESKNSFSIWYFKNDLLIAVEAVNFPKAYILGGRFIKSGQLLSKSKIADPETPFKPQNFIKTP